MNPGIRPTLRVEINDTTQIAAARRSAIELARELGFDEEDVGRAALVTTEAASNVLKHAGSGEVLLSMRHMPCAGLEVIAIDRGEGFHAPTASRDGYSTSGTLGQGLGAMQRMSNELQLYSQPSRGSIVRAMVCPADSHRDETFEYGAIALPYPGESICGDAWMCRVQDSQALVIVADGLGHGGLAHLASSMAVDEPPAMPQGPKQVLERAHAAMRSTRGAAMAVVQIDLGTMQLRHGGVGNIGAQLAAHDGAKHLVSMAGIVGHNVRTLREFAQPFDAGSVLVMHSDGLGTHWSLHDDPTLRSQHPSVIAAALYRDHTRGRDDVTVFVARFRAA
jgi:anti-sigma regulatory factor (Ser/Thr protein kinase)